MQLRHMLSCAAQQRHMLSRGNFRLLGRGAAQSAVATEASDEPYVRPESLPLLQLPEELERALELETIPWLRSLEGAQQAPASADPEATASVHEFAAARLDEMYAAAHRTLHETQSRLPQFEPRRVLEFGAGLAPVAWAAREVWPEADLRVVAVEPSSELRAVGAALCADGPAVTWSDKLPPDAEQFDLVSAAFCLETFPPTALGAVLGSLWARTAPGGVLALIHPGSAVGFNTMLLARTELCGDETQAQIVAPCPHSRQCPLAPGGPLQAWHGAKTRQRGRTAHAPCHALQPVVESSARHYMQRKARKGRAKHKRNERFCYLLLRRPSEPATEAQASWSRVVRPPRVRSRHVLLDVCTPAGNVMPQVVTKRKHDRRCYRHARKAKLGAVWPWPLQSVERAADHASDHVTDHAADEYEEVEYEYDDYDDER